MASPSARAAAAAARGHDPSRETASDLAKREPAAGKLDEPETQAAILNPDPEFAMINGREVKLHKLAARYSRALAGLAVAALQDSTAARGAGGSGLTMRLMAILNGKLGEDFLPLLAMSFKPAGEITWEQATFTAQQLADEIAYDELGWAWVKMLALNKIMDVITTSVKQQVGNRP